MSLGADTCMMDGNHPSCHVSRQVHPCLDRAIWDINHCHDTYKPVLQEHQQKEGKLGEDWTMEGEGSQDKDAAEILKMERTMVMLVVKRLYTKDRVLLCVREPDLAQGETQGDRLLVVHPQHDF